MITRKALRAIALATTCLAPLAAFAQTPAPSYEGTLITGDIGVGLMGVFGNNTDEAGRYNGLNTTGIDAYANFDLRGGAAWDSGGTRYYELQGNNLVYQTGNRLGSGGNGLLKDNAWQNSVNNSLGNEGSLSFKAGDQGTWGVSGYYNAITYTGNVIDSLYTINNGRGTLNNSLAPFGGATFGAAGPVAAFTVPSLGATGAMLPFQTGTRRDIVGGDAKYMWGDWTFTIAARHEHKEGSMEESLDNTYGGTVFALPIDSDTDRYDVSAQYASRLWQGVFQYTYSHYSDNLSYVSLPYPVSNAALPHQLSAAYSTPPSNEAQYATVELASNIIPATRVNLNLRAGVEKQDDTFPPNTADPNPTGAAGVSALNSLLQGTTAPSPDIVATVYQVKLSAASHPFPNFDTRVYYGLDARNVSLNQNAVTTGGEGGLTADGSLNGGMFFVVPQEWLKQDAGGEVGYRILPASDTKLTVGYRFDSVGRSNAQVGHSYTNTATVALSSQLGPTADGKISFDYADRSGLLSYLTPWLNLSGPPPGATYSGAYYQAPMTSEAVTARADYNPLPNLGGSMFIQFRNEDFSYPAVNASTGATPPGLPFLGVGEGIKQDYALVLGPDVNYRPIRDVNLHFFYTYELLFYNNVDNGACTTLPVTPDCIGTVGYFQNKYTSGTHTVGVNGEWKVNDKLTLKADYTFSYGSVAFTQFNGVFVTKLIAGDSYQNVTNFPDVNSTMHNLILTASYALTPNVELVGEGLLMNFHNTDWRDTANAIQGAGTPAISILTPGYEAPNYTEVALMAGVKFKL
jgi:hypothetical protein